MASLAELSPRAPAAQFAEGEELPIRRSLDDDGPSKEDKVKSLPLRKSKTTDSYSRGRRSLAFLERFRSRPQSMIEEEAPTNTSSGNSGSFFRRKSNDEDIKFKYSGRRSTDFTGAYADVARAQAIYMEKLREEQEKKNIKHNIDGIPIRPPSENRRSGLMQALGMEKALLAR
ncbi:hypothetical protein B0O80DRAFT_484941 [Mortierella sp. GBAus27b]|nr:hypothetical protein BGX31_004015 [Mortierella sp. GBA43]KAI8358881.1 hypothetical protein B0O80DRAFT_484941 [Mortierella sp. GBAus27b]